MTPETAPVMIAFDGSDASRRAIDAAADLFGDRHAIVVTIWEPSIAYAVSDLEPMGPELSPIPVDVQGAQEIEDELAENARRTAAQGAELAKAAGLDCEALAVADQVSVPETLVDLARKRDVAALVVGSRGLSGLRARLEGSTSSAVLRHASCPIVVVH